MQCQNGEVAGIETPVGVIPARDELNLDGLNEQALADLDTVLSIDIPRWQQEIGFREEHLAQFDDLPEAIWTAHRPGGSCPRNEAVRSPRRHLVAAAGYISWLACRGGTA